MRIDFAYIIMELDMLLTRRGEFLGNLLFDRPFDELLSPIERIFLYPIHFHATRNNSFSNATCGV